MNNYNIEHNAVREYFEKIKNRIGTESLSALLNGNKDSDSPVFLSVIMRTQGRRIAALSEVLLCLNAQTNRNFEVLLMGHNLPEDAKPDVEKVLSELPEELREKVRLIEVAGGTRTTPLSEGFKNARGEYISILDDDDLVFENWVEEFYKLYENNAGKILHTYCVDQKWKVYNEDGVERLVSVSGFGNAFCRDFDMLEQTVSNHCPTMTLAFPAYAYNLLGIRFDETLTTTEDWDFLMKVAFVCGVCDAQAVTSIYRFWENAEASRSLHNKKEWNDNYQKILKRINENTVLLDLSSRDANSEKHSVSDNRDLMCGEMFIDDGEGYSEDKKWSLDNKIALNPIDVIFSDFDDCGAVSKIRIDPISRGMVLLKEFTIEVLDEDDRKVKLHESYLKSNGTHIGKYRFFIGADPQIIFNLKKPVKIKSVTMRINRAEVLSATKAFFFTGIHFFHRIIKLFAIVVYKVWQKIFGRKNVSAQNKEGEKP